MIKSIFVSLNPINGKSFDWRLLASLFVTTFTFAFFPAQASDEKKCADQYSLEEQQILEWAAIGGDPHAQFSMAQCSFPLGTKKLTRAEKFYAVQWIALARCEALDTDTAHRHNARTRTLKEDGKLSFRRFTGGEDESGWTKREKMFQHYRRQRIVELENRGEQLNNLLSEDERRIAQNEMVDRFSRMGPMGLTRLASLSDCEHFSANESLSAAAWQVAAETWSDANTSELYGKSDVKGWSFKKESKKRTKKLDQIAENKVAIERGRLLRTSQANLAALEDQAALSAIENLSIELPATHFAHVAAQEVNPVITESQAASAIPASFSLSSNATELVTNAVNETPTVALAAQYALEALGLMKFINGPDNDYGPATLEAVEKFQSKNGYERTRWLSHQQIRDAICQAASQKDDPVSLMHLSFMHAEGLGYVQDYNKALKAAEAAQASMEETLEKQHKLPAWKQRHYPVFAQKIAAQSQVAAIAWADQPDWRKQDPSNVELCN